MNNDGSTKALIRFCLPLILSGVLQQLYSWADAFIVGHVNGEAALAAVGATATITDFFILSIGGFTLGLSIYGAQKHGQGNTVEIGRILSSFTIILGIAFSVLAALGYVFSPSVLALINTPNDMFGYAQDYLQIIFIGIPFMAIYNLYASLLRAIGNSKAPFYAVLISSVSNVLLDVLFVVVLHFGVIGAAVATVVSQLAMTVFTVIYAIRKYPSMRYKIRGKVLYFNTVKQGFKFGFPPAIQSGVTSFGNIILQNFMNGFGTQTVAAITTAYRIDSIMLLPVVNFGTGLSTLVAQSKGACRIRRIENLLASGIKIIVATSVTLAIVMALLGGNLIAMFGVENEAIKIGRTFFHNISVFYLFYGVATALRGTVEGLGNVVYSSVAGIVSLGMRIALSYSLVSSLANLAIPYAEGLSWICLLLLYIPNLIVCRKDFSLRLSRPKIGRLSA